VFIHDEIAFNYRLSNLHAALGVAQLEQIDGFVEDKRATARHYASLLSRVPGVDAMAEPPESRSTFWMATASLDPGRYPDVRGLIAAYRQTGNFELRRTCERTINAIMSDKLWNRDKKLFKSEQVVSSGSKYSN
jgi:perosamine synthetase